MAEKRSKIILNAIKILDFLIEENAMAGGDIRVQQIFDTVALPKKEFDSADSYLLQQNYAEGTMGGMGGSRWLTGAGVEFYEDNISEMESVLIRCRGENNNAKPAESFCRAWPRQPIADGFFLIPSRS